MLAFYKKSYIVSSLIYFILIFNYDSFAARDDGFKIFLKSRQFIPVIEIKDDDRASLNQQLSVMSREYGLNTTHKIIQFTHKPSKIEKVQLKNRGIELLSYIPHNAWYAAITLPAKAFDEYKEFRWTGPLVAADKIAPNILNRNIGNRTVNPYDTISLQVIFFKDVPHDLARSILNKYSSDVLGSGMIHKWTITIPALLIKNLAGEDSVKWVDETAAPFVPANDVTRAAVYINEVQSDGLSGAGVRVGIWDHVNISNHPDVIARVTQVEYSGTGEHAVFVAAIIGGDGTMSESAGGIPLQWRGMAPGVSFYGYHKDGDPPAEVVAAITTYDIDLSQNSWSDPDCPYPIYSTISANYDDIIHNGVGISNKKIPVVFSAGNWRRPEHACGRDYFTVSGVASAKNVITVGATNSDDDSMTDFSSWGPTDDGRIKPDLVAPGNNKQGEICSNGTVLENGVKSATAGGGTYINKCNLSDYYGRSNGTSYSSPVVSGAIALMLERYRQLFGAGSMPLPSTFKGILIHATRDLGNPGPDYEFGYGRINVKKAICLLDNNRFLEGDILSEGEEDIITVNIGSNASQFKVTLVWDDYKGDPPLSKQLINDLDLVLVDPAGADHLPWILDQNSPADPATTGQDHLNNVEQVVVQNPLAGQWTIKVKGTDVPESPQTYSLIEGTAFPVRTNAAIPEYYSDLQTAYDAVDEGAILESHADEFYENLHIDSNKVVNLMGGYNCNFTTVHGKSTIHGKMTVSDGMVRIGNYVLK